MLRSSEKGINLAWNILLQWPESNESLTVAVSQFQRMTCLSSEPETRISPSPLKLTVFTQPLCFWSFLWRPRRSNRSWSYNDQSHKLEPNVEINRQRFEIAESHPHLGGRETIGESPIGQLTNLPFPDIDQGMVGSRPFRRPSNHQIDELGFKSV